jgi:putative acetyltransferase
MHIRPIHGRDNSEVAALIRKVMPEFGAEGQGFAVTDLEVDGMFEAYQARGSRYFVIADESVAGVGTGTVYGVGGYAPLLGAPSSVCEVRKMYFLPELRSQGYGRRLLQIILDSARQDGYEYCYLETLTAMVQAQHLYEKFGFQALAKPLGATGHFGCDRWYGLNLS